MGKHIDDLCHILNEIHKSNGRLDYEKYYTDSDIMDETPATALYEYTSDTWKDDDDNPLDNSEINAKIEYAREEIESKLERLQGFYANLAKIKAQFRLDREFPQTED